MELFVDPIVLTIPKPDSPREVCMNYIEQLMMWSREVKVQRHSFFVSGSCLDASLKAGRFPSRQALLPFLQTSGITSADPNTIDRACASILNNMPYLERRFAPSYLHVHSARAAPNIVQRLDEPVASAFEEALGYLTYAREVVRHPGAESLALVTHPLAADHQVHIDAKIQVPDTSQDSVDLETDIPFVECPQDLMELEGLRTFWLDTARALDWAVSQLVKKSRIQPSTSIKPYRVAKEFNESISKTHLEDHPDLLARVFWQVASLLTGYIPPVSTHTNHPLQKDHRAYQLLDGSGRRWEAWRLWITSGSSAIRLHYWRNHSSHILDCVGPHENYDIGPLPRDI